MNKITLLTLIVFLLVASKLHAQWHVDRDNESTGRLTIGSISSNGKVGIGTNNPSFKLHIKNPPEGAAIGIERGNKLWRFDIEYTGNNLFLDNSSSSSDTPLFTYSNTGKFGIGTKNPQEKFQIANSYLFHDGGHKVIGFLYKPSGDIDMDNKQFSAEIRFDPTDGNLRLGTSSTVTNSPITHFSIDKNGKVGIGTTKPDMKLTVKGNIHAEEVKIDLNVPAPDYVFKPDYNLRSIEEIENFIKKHGHLPEIPSAKEFAQNGVMQAEMDMNLLKKIEELTLYTIQQEKKLKTQEKKIIALEKEKFKNNRQQEEIEELKTLVQKLIKDKN